MSLAGRLKAGGFPLRELPAKPESMEGTDEILILAWIGAKCRQLE